MAVNETVNGTVSGGLGDFLHPIGAAMDPVFSHLTIFPPYVTIFIVSVVLTVVVMAVSRLFVNRKLMMQVKEQMEEIKEKLNHAQKAGDKVEQEKYLSELMKANSNYMKHTMRIMVVSIAVVFLFYPWLSFHYGGTESVVKLPFTVPFVDWTSLEWFWWYVLTAFASGQVIRKIIGSDI